MKAREVGGAGARTVAIGIGVKPTQRARQIGGGGYPRNRQRVALRERRVAKNLVADEQRMR